MAQDRTNNDRHESGCVLAAPTMSQMVEVRKMSGEEWCSVLTTEALRGQDLKHVIARKMKVCECRLVLVAGKYKVRNRTPMVKIRKWVQPLNILYVVTLQS